MRRSPPTKKNELSDNFLEILTKEEKKFIYKELAEKFKWNLEHLRRICIKLFTEGKIERVPIIDNVGRPYFRYCKK